MCSMCDISALKCFRKNMWQEHISTYLDGVLRCFSILLVLKNISLYLYLTFIKGPLISCLDVSCKWKIFLQKSVKVLMVEKESEIFQKIAYWGKWNDMIIYIIYRRRLKSWPYYQVERENECSKSWHRYSITMMKRSNKVPN